MKRRTFVQMLIAASFASPLRAALKQERLDEAEAILTKATASGQVTSAVLHVVQGDTSFTRRFGRAADVDAMFLLGSISKPICITALITLFDRGQFRLDDPVKKFIPQFVGDGRDGVTMRHLMTHVSGLPDQLAQNNKLRQNHASLEEFVEQAIHTPLMFAPGTRYQYSSMAILLASHIGQIITGTGILPFVDQCVFKPLGMKHSAIGLGAFALDQMVPCQTEFGAPEAGAGNPNSKDWDWNSPYWRKLGAPWGGVHASAPDLARFLDEFLHARGTVVKSETAKLMIRNHNPQGITPRGLGFDVNVPSGPTDSQKSFGHTGSTGTIAWASPSSKTICVVLTSLPGRAVNPHPRDLAAASVAASSD